MKPKTIQRSGVVDSISNFLRNYNCDSKRLVNLLLKVLEKCTKDLIGHSRLAFNNHESNIDC